MNWLRNYTLLFVALAASLCATEGEAPSAGCEGCYAEYDSASYWDKQVFGWKSELLISVEHGLILTAPVARCAPYNCINCTTAAGEQLWSFAITFPAKFVCWAVIGDQLLVLLANCDTYENVLYSIDMFSGTENWVRVEKRDGTAETALDLQ